MLAELYVLSGREAGKGIHATPGMPTIFVGRAATNQIRVRDPAASRVHCRIDVTAEGLILHDNNSGNGTFVNGLRIGGTKRLEDQDEIQLGETRIFVLIEQPEERARWSRAGAGGSESAPLDDSLGDGSQVSSVAPVESSPLARDPEPGEEDEDDDLEVVEDEDEVEETDVVATPTDAAGAGGGGAALDAGAETARGAAAAEEPVTARGAALDRADKRRQGGLREVLPGYRIEARLGGHSRAGVAVYRALQVSLERPVALKVLLARGPGREREVERFLREARAIARLPHPNIVTIHDVLTRGTLRVIVMEHVAGGNLADRIDGGPLAAVAVLRVGEAVARALAYAHSHEVVHRNVKPSNVLYAPEIESYKLGDFGLATGPGHGRAGDTSFLDLPLESLPFVPPELLREDHQPDPRTDVYALGATLHACVTGAPPFRGASSAEVAAKVLRDDPAPLGGAPAPLVALIRRAMAKDPAERFADGGAILYEVRAALASVEALVRGKRAP